MAKRLMDYLFPTANLPEYLIERKRASSLSEEQLQSEIKSYYDSQPWYSRFALKVHIKSPSPRIRAMEVDLTNRLRSERLAEQQEAELSQIPIPSPPRDLNDKEDMARYDREMNDYMAKTTPIRARYADIWRNERKR